MSKKKTFPPHGGGAAAPIGKIQVDKRVGSPRGCAVFLAGASYLDNHYAHKAMVAKPQHRNELFSLARFLTGTFAGVCAKLYTIGHRKRAAQTNINCDSCQPFISGNRVAFQPVPTGPRDRRTRA